MKDVIIFGSTGNIGYGIKNFLSKKNLKLYYPTRKECDLNNFKSATNYFKKLNKKNKKFSIIFCASDTKNKNKVQCLKNNINIVSNIILLKQYITIESFVYLSTILILNKNYLSRKTNFIKYSQDSYYEISKYYAEKLIIDNLSKNKLTILRIPGVYGLKNESIVNYLIASIKNKKNFTLHNKGLDQRCYLYQSDLNKVVLYFIKNPVKATINLLDDDKYKIIDIVFFIENVMSIKAKYKFKNIKESYDITLKSNINKYFKDFKFTNYKNGIRQIIKKFK